MGGGCVCLSVCLSGMMIRVRVQSLQSAEIIGGGRECTVPWIVDERVGRESRGSWVWHERRNVVDHRNHLGGLVAFDLPAAAAFCLTFESGDDRTLSGDWCVPGRLGRTTQVS